MRGCERGRMPGSSGLGKRCRMGPGEGGGRVFFTVFASVWCAMFSVDFFSGKRLQSTG